MKHIVDSHLLGLSDTEAEALITHEAVIERGVRTFIEVGEALLAIREQRLYRVNFDTFEEYCRERWGFSDNYARRLILSSDVVKSVPMGTVTTERQARELARVPVEERPAVIERATGATGGKLTAAAIRQAASPVTCDQEDEDEDGGHPQGEDDPRPRKADLKEQLARVSERLMAEQKRVRELEKEAKQWAKWGEQRQKLRAQVKDLKERNEALQREVKEGQDTAKVLRRRIDALERSLMPKAPATQDVAGA